MTPPPLVTVVHANETRRTETPSAIMTTLASPTLGGTTALSLWRVSLAAGSTGPLHRIDSEQIWTLLSGEATCTVDAVVYSLHAGDTIPVSGTLLRQFAAITDTVFIVCGDSRARATTPASDTAVTPPWIA